MKTATIVHLSVLAVLFATPVSAADDQTSPVVVTLELPRSSVLPGVPFDLFVTVKNVSHHPIAVGSRGRLIVTPAGSSAVRTDPEFRIQHESMVQTPVDFDLEAGETERGFIPWSSNWFFADEHFTIPGAYDLTLVLAGDPKESDDYVGEVTSSTVRLTRLEPTGDDAVVWKQLEEASGGHWPSHGFFSNASERDLAADVIANHRESNYYPYALILNGLAPELTGDVARDAVKRFPDSPAYPYLLVHAGAAAYRQAATLERAGGSAMLINESLHEAEEFHRAALKTGNAAVKTFARDGATNSERQAERIRARQSPK